VYTAEVSVYVDPKHHGRGAGTALYGALIPTLAAQGYRTVIAVIALPNPASERLHEAFGFQNVGRLRRVGWKLGQWHDVALWQCILHDGEDEPAPIRTINEIRGESR